MSKASDPRISLNALLDSTRDSIQKAIKLELGQYNMSQSQVKIMHMIYNNKELMTLNQIAEISIRELNSVTTLVNRMLKKELVEKIRKPGDSRSYIALTEKGKDIYENTVTERSITLIFDALDDKEKEDLRVLLNKLQTKARNLLGLDYTPPFLQKD
jgi:DNA-binding MarR family transcriptional regulator